jgi:hypothetical protein
MLQCSRRREGDNDFAGQPPAESANHADISSRVKRDETDSSAVCREAASLPAAPPFANRWTEEKGRAVSFLGLDGR